MTLSAAQLMVTIGGNAAGAQAAISSTAAMMGKTGMLGMAAVGAGAIMAATGVIATKMAGDFQAGIASLATGAGEAGGIINGQFTGNLKLAADGVKQLALETGTSTSGLISGLYMIESGGFHGAAGLAILKAAAEGAKVGNADLGVIADTTDTILKNFGENGALTASQAVNALITTVANGKTHLEDLGNSLSGVLPAGAAAGLGLKDVLGAMAELTNVGIPAAEASTYLRQMIIALEAPSSGAVTALNKIGISTDQLAAKMKQGLPQALQFIESQLENHGIKPGTAQYVAALREISGGTRQMQGMLNLMGPHLADFADKVNKIGGAASTTGDKITGWDLVQKTFNQSLDKAGATLQVLMINLGQKLLPVATNFFNWLSGTAMPKIQQFAGWLTTSGKNMDGMRQALILGAAVIGGVLTAAFVAWAGAAAAAAVATIAATWPVLLIGALIGGLVYFIIQLVQHWNELTKAGGPLHDIMQALQPQLKMVGDLFGAMGKMWQTTILPALAQLLPVLKILGIVLAVVILIPIAGLILGFIALAAAVTGVIFILVKLVQGIVWLVTHIGVVAEAVRKWAADLAGNITKKFMDFQKGLMKWGHDLAVGIVSRFKDLQEGVEQKAHDLASGVTNWFLKLQTNIEQTAHDLAANFIKKMLDFEHNLIQKGHDIATNFINTLSSLPGKLLALGEQLMKNLAQGIRNARSSVVSALSNIPIIGGIAGKLNSIIPAFASGGTMAQNGLALVGEQGPELVYLPAGARVSPNVGGGSGSGGYANGQPIVVNLVVDGQRLAQATARHMPAVVRNATGKRNF